MFDWRGKSNAEPLGETTVNWLENLDPWKKGVRAGDHATLTVEAGDPSTLERAEGVAIVSTWMKTPAASLSLSAYLKQLSNAGLTPLVVDASPFDEPIQWPDGLPSDAVVTRRPNVGYDFGSWAAAMRVYPCLAEKPKVLLTNDSMVGPFASMDAVFEAENRSTADVFSLTDSYQGPHHPQSFFLLFKGGILAEAPWQRFFAGVREQQEKEAIVGAYEFGVPRVAATNGYSWEAMLPAAAQGHGKENPTLAGWREMLAMGAPLIKRNIVTDPNYVATASEMVSAVQRRYGQNVSDWLPQGYAVAQLSSQQAGGDSR